MEFNKGAELDKQIYKEGEPTGGCKSGVLDVEDVKEFINSIKIDLYDWVETLEDRNVIQMIINKKAGEKLV